MNAGWIWGTPKVKPARQNNFKYRQKLTSSNNNLKLYLRFKPWGTNKHPTGWSYLAASPEAWHPGMPGWRWPSCHRWSGWGPCRPDLRLHGLPSSPERRINEELRMFLKAVEGSIMIGACKKEGNHMFQRSISVCVCGGMCVCAQRPPSVCACVAITDSGRYLTAHTHLSPSCGCDETYQQWTVARLTTTTKPKPSVLLLQPLILIRGIHVSLTINIIWETIK